MVLCCWYFVSLSLSWIHLGLKTILHSSGLGEPIITQRPFILTSCENPYLIFFFFSNVHSFLRLHLWWTLTSSFFAQGIKRGKYVWMLMLQIGIVRRPVKLLHLKKIDSLFIHTCKHLWNNAVMTRWLIQTYAGCLDLRISYKFIAWM